MKNMEQEVYNIYNFLNDNLAYIISFLSICVTLVSVILTSNRAKETNRITEKLAASNFVREEKKKQKDIKIQDICRFLELSSPYKVNEWQQRANVVGTQETPDDFQLNISSYITELTTLYNKMFLQMDSAYKSYIESIFTVLEHIAKIYLKLKTIKTEKYYMNILNPNVKIDELNGEDVKAKIDNLNNEVKSIFEKYSKDYVILTTKSRDYVKDLNNDYMLSLDNERDTKNETKIQKPTISD